MRPSRIYYRRNRVFRKGATRTVPLTNHITNERHRAALACELRLSSLKGGAMYGYLNFFAIRGLSQASETLFKLRVNWDFGYLDTIEERKGNCRHRATIRIKQ